MSERSKSLANALIESLGSDLSAGNLTDKEAVNKIIDSLKKTLSLDASPSHKPSEEDLAKAEELKVKGNAALSSDNAFDAIRCYQEAIKLVPDNAIYYANLSAAHLQAGDSQEAKVAAEMAIQIDPSYAKGYIRLANAESAQGKKTEAISAIEQGLLVNPGNAALETHLKTISGTASPRTTSTSPNPLGNLFNNPEIMRMASQMMNTPGGLEGLMNNPQVAEMMRNPQFMEMMKQYMQPPPK